MMHTKEEVCRLCVNRKVINEALYFSVEVAKSFSLPSQSFEDANAFLEERHGTLYATFYK